MKNDLLKRLSNVAVYIDSPSFGKDIRQLADAVNTLHGVVTDLVTAARETDPDPAPARHAEDER